MRCPMYHTPALVQQAGHDKLQDGIPVRASRLRPRPVAGCLTARLHPRQAYPFWSTQLDAAHNRAYEACCRQIRCLWHLLASPITVAHGDARSAASWARAESGGAQGRGGESEKASRKALTVDRA